MVLMSLSDAIESWENVGKTMALHPLPKVNILATVVKWGVPKKCELNNKSLSARGGL